MANETKKYASLDNLRTFKENTDELYATQVDVDTKLSGKANTSHIHDDRYYTESEVDTLLSNKSDSNHNHDTKYDAKGSANTALESAKSYTDTKTSGLASTSSVNTSISNHNTSTTSHEDIRALIDGLTTRLNTVANSDDTTLDQLSEIVAYIKANKTLIDGITTSKINVSDIVNNLTTNSTTKVLSAAQGVAINGLIDALQTELDTLEGVVATKATITALDSHVNNKDNPHEVTLAQLGVTATANELNKLDGVTVTTTELNYVDGVTSNIQIQLDDKTPISRTINGKSLSSDVTLSASDVGADASGSASSALASSQAYTDEQVSQKTQVQMIIWGDDD